MSKVFVNFFETGAYQAAEAWTLNLPASASPSARIAGMSRHHTQVMGRFVFPSLVETANYAWEGFFFLKLPTIMDSLEF